ncbi:helix-turn-helix domain-containing protein (plasmid) [Thermoanaerobacterium thermosaccharolyticum]|uniref:helix-turn-helix domain-containing protein n=1 Tax=Thermoanaerobacterium thermosaccharolyticum TaxID=1517 RepID=UPI003DA9E870
MEKRRCPVCGGELVTVYKTFEVDGKEKVKNVPVIMCPKCNISLVNTELLINITERSELEDKDELLKELKKVKTDEEIRHVLEQYKFQNHIYEVLIKKGMSLKRLANMLDVTDSYVYILAKKNQSTNIRTALKMAYALDVDVNELYTLEKEVKTNLKFDVINKLTDEVHDNRIKEELKKLDVNVYIEDVLEEKGVKKSQLSRRLGIAPQSLNKIIKVTKGNAKIETALKIAKALDVDVNRIYRLE